MNPSHFELHATIKQREQTLMREAERYRLLAARPVRISWLGYLLARIGRLLIATGTRLESRYAKTVVVPPPVLRPGSEQVG